MYETWGSGPGGYVSGWCSQRPRKIAALKQWSRGGPSPPKPADPEFTVETRGCVSSGSWGPRYGDALIVVFNLTWRSHFSPESCQTSGFRDQRLSQDDVELDSWI